MRGRLSAVAVAASSALSVALALAWLTLAPHPAAACAVCFGAAEGAEAAGLRAGILLLLGMVALVFAGVGGFLVAARRRLQRLQASDGGLRMIEFARSLGLPAAASAHAGQVDGLIGWVHLLMLVLFVGWGAFFFYVLVRFRKRRQPRANYHGTHSHLSRYLEGVIAVIEIALLFGLSVPVWARQIANPVAAEEAHTIRVVGQQFAWNIHYPGADGMFGATSTELVDAEVNPLGVDRDDLFAKDDIVTVNQLHIPVNTPIRIELSSFDVVHSFSLPEMRVKQDAIPGMVIPLSFTATATGEWEIACAQLCGLGHYRMRGFFTVHDQSSYDAWMAERVAALEAAAQPKGFFD